MDLPTMEAISFFASFGAPSAWAISIPYSQTYFHFGPIELLGVIY